MAALTSAAIFYRDGDRGVPGTAGWDAPFQPPPTRGTPAERLGLLPLLRHFDQGDAVADRLRLAQPYVDLRADENDAEGDEHRADRVLDEDQRVAARDQHGAAEVLLEARPQYETEQDRRRVEVEQQQDVADDADDHDFADLEHVVVGAVDADADEEQRARIEVLVRNGEQLHPQPDHRHVENDQDDVADPEARHQAPEDVGVFGDELRPGHHALNHQRAEDERHNRVAGNAERHGRDEIALAGGMRRGLRAGDAFDHASAEFLRRLGDFLFHRVGHEGSDGRPGAGDERAQAADDGAAEHGRHRTAEFIARRLEILELDVGVFGVDL